jgi:hypothetical protein
MSSVSAFRWTRAPGKRQIPALCQRGGLPGDALGYWWRISAGGSGKANGEMMFLLSQIVLNDHVFCSFRLGPLKVPDTLPVDLKNAWRAMHPDQLDLIPELVNRFNAWRELTLGQTTPKTFDPEAASHYEPPAAGGSLETVIAEQMAWITAWRIDRYARGSMLKTPFYQRATNTEALPAARKAAEDS